MSAVVSVWSKVLIPDQDTLLTEDVTIQITQITLEVDESKPASEKRSVVKLQHLEAAPGLLRAAAGYGYDSDSDMDSDDDEEIDSDELPEDDDEEMDASMAEADTSKASKSSKKAKTNGMSKTEAVAAGEDAEEEDDEDEESDDISYDSDFDREEAEVQLASLLPGRIEQIQTNVILPAGEDFVLKLTGPYKVHLFGHYIVQPVPPQFDQPPYGYDSDEIGDSDEDSDKELSESEMGVFDPATGAMIEYDDSEDDDSEGDDSERFEEIDSRPKKTAKEASKRKAAPKAAAAAPAAAPAKKAETKAAPAAAASTSATEVDKSKLSKNQLKKLAKKEKDAAATAATPAEEKPAAKAESKKAAEPAAAAKPTEAAKKAPSKKQTLPSGVVIEDVKAGNGAAAKSGQRVQMRYIGRLQSGKIFDQNTKGEPFAFKLGKGEVIKGWDVGIAGMQVGGERRLTIPAAMAYGKQSIAGIPANSTLIFEVKLLAVK